MGIFPFLILLACVLVVVFPKVFDYTPLYNATFEKYLRKGFVDNISTRVPLFNWMRKSKCLEFWDGSGKWIVEEVISSLPTLMQALGPYEQINLQPFAGTTLVPFQYKELVFPITITHREMANNKGREQAINLLKSKTKIAELALAEQLEDMLLGDGTAQGGKVMLGISAFMPDDNTSGSVGGYTRSANTWLRCPVVDAIKTSIQFDNLRVKLSNLKNTCTRGSVRPEIYITTQTVYEGYETLSFGKWTPTMKGASTDIGFDGDLTFAGKPFVFGDSITAGEVLALNSDSLKLRVEGLKKSDDSPFKLEGPYNMLPHQKATVWLITLAGAVTMNMFRQNGKLINAAS